MDIQLPSLRGTRGMLTTGSTEGAVTYPNGQEHSR